MLSAVDATTVGEPLPAWSAGYLDLHQIHTGRGNSLYAIFPDGTTMLFDAGEVPDGSPLALGPRRPNAGKSAGEWIADYVKHLGGRIDYLVLSHFHDDHVSGVEAITRALPVRTWIDRGEDPAPPTFPGLLRFFEVRRQFTGQRQTFTPGRLNQIGVNYPNFEIRNIAANGAIWTGRGDTAKSVFPSDWRKLAKDLHPNENHFSIAIRLRYGKFDYFTGGDLIGVALDGLPAWHDLETPIAKVVGPVDAMALNHHGWLDTTNDFFLKTLNPKVAVISAWHASHPDHSVMRRLRSPRGPQPDLFITSLLDAPRAVFGYLGNAFQSSEGHILIRVAPGGATYSVIILDTTGVPGNVKGVFGPYPSR
jgi:beta-lactamase superfamily II metal-dependent hydrolase